MCQTIQEQAEKNLQYQFDMKESKLVRRNLQNEEDLNRKLRKYKDLNHNYEEVLKKEKMKYAFQKFFFATRATKEYPQIRSFLAGITEHAFLTQKKDYKQNLENYKQECVFLEQEITDL